MAGAFPHPDPFAPLPPELETGPIAEPIPTLLTPGKVATVAAGAMAAPAIAPILAAGYSIPGVGPSLASAAAPPPLPPPTTTLPASQSLPGPMTAPPAPAPARRPGGGGGGPAAPAQPAGPSALEQEIIGAGQQGQQGIERTQQAKTEGADALARAQEDLSVQQRMDAQELADRQTRNRALQADLDKQDEANLRKARDYIIPDFWKGAEGSRVGSILSIAMGNIASSVLGGPNAALQIVNKNVDDYFHRQKDKIDNLYRYAEQTGRINDKTRMRYAQELVDLQQQHTAVQASILSRIDAVKAKNQGNVDAASTDSLQSALRMQVAQGRETAQQNQAQIFHMQRSDAETARHNRATEGIQREQLAASKAATRADDSLIFDANGRPFANAQTPQAAQKFREQQTALADLGKAIGELEGNYGKGATLPGGITATGRERDAIMSRIVLAAKTVGQLGALSGPDLTLVQDLAGGNVGKYLGNTAGIGNLRRLHETGINTALAQIGAHPTPENRQRFVAPGTPEGQPAQQSQQIPVGARSTSQGRPIVMTANGWQFAQ